jgi:hypothetical protein
MKLREYNPAERDGDKFGQKLGLAFTANELATEVKVK